VIARLVQRAWLWSARGAERAFRAAQDDPARAQRELLLRFLRRHAQSAFGRAHDLATLEVADFRARVPLQEWHAVAPWVERIRLGETNVLTSDPVLRLVPTSGTASAVKLIPWTVGLQRGVMAAIGPWVRDLARTYDGVLDGPAYWAISPPATTTPTVGAVPIGFAEDTAWLGRCIGPLVAHALAVPPHDPALRDPQCWLAATASHLRACRDLRLISAWHPSFVGLILDHLGVPSSGADLRAWWPRLAAVSCWADGPAAVPATQLAARIAPVPLAPKGLLATEGVTTIPYAGSNRMALTSHVIEVLDADGRCHWAHELQPGMRGEVVLTTGGGLWRYRTGDLVEVVAGCAATPGLRFLGRRGQVHDLAGEKLDEELVAAALSAAEVRAGFAALRPDPQQRPARWRLVLDTDAPDPAAQAAAVEVALQRCVHYAVARRLGQLAPLEVERDPRPASAIIAALAGERGIQVGSFKAPVLLPARPAAQDAAGDGQPPVRC